MLPDLIIPMAMAGPWIPPSPRGRTKDAYLFLSGSSRLLFLYLLPDFLTDFHSSEKSAEILGPRIPKQVLK